MIIKKTYEIQTRGDFDVIVAGGGVAGVAAALSARNEGMNVLLIEKSAFLGGLATQGLITFFVPMCNGRGKQIVKGMADEFLHLATKYGYDDIPDDWKDGEPTHETKQRLRSHYDMGAFALALNKALCDAGVEILYDSCVTDIVMDNNICKGLIVENKSGKGYYSSKIIIDVTGDADVLYRSGVPCVQGKNYFTYIAHKISLSDCDNAIKNHNIGKAIKWVQGGPATLYGTNQPADRPMYSGTNGDKISEYIRENQLVLLDKIKDDDRFSRAIVTMPGMAQFRTTRHIDGDYTLTTDDVFKHFDDSITAICDMDHRDYLYEIPYRCICRKDYPNLLTAGRCVSASGYAWDVARVIPPAIVTGQAAGIAASISIKSQVNVAEIDIKLLQNKLIDGNVLLHFDDAWIPEILEPYDENIDHI